MRNFDEPLVGGPDNQAEEDGPPLGAAENEADESGQPVEWPRGYVVDPNHQPGSLDRTGSLRSEHVGAVGIERLAPAFDVARRRSLLTGARAIDPTDTGVSEDHINRSPGSPPDEAIEDRILGKLEQESPYLTPADTLSVRTDRSESRDQPPPPSRKKADSEEDSVPPSAEEEESNPPEGEDVPEVTIPEVTAPVNVVAPEEETIPSEEEAPSEPSKESAPKKAAAKKAASPKKAAEKTDEPPADQESPGSSE